MPVPMAARVLIPFLNSSMVQFHPAPPRASDIALSFPYILATDTEYLGSQYVILLGSRYR